MTDQTIPADLSQGPYTLDDVWLARDWAAHILKTPGSSIPMEQSAARVLQALLPPPPPPPPPTLADMTPEERRECQLMQCEVRGFQGQLVLATTCDDGDDAVLISDCGEVVWSSPGHVTPRPDLPRLEWPGAQKPAPAPTLPEGWRLADHQKYGRVIVTSPEPDVHGDVWFVRTDPHGNPEGFGAGFCKPAELTFLDGPESPAPVPPNTLAEGSEWDDADALARACDASGRDQIVVTDKDGDVFVWDEMAEWWESPMPPRRDPYTILHAGHETDW